MSKTKTKEDFEESVRYWSKRWLFKKQVLEFAAEEMKMTTRQRALARRRWWAMVDELEAM